MLLLAVTYRAPTTDPQRIFAAGFILGGAAVLALGIRIIRLDRAIARWPRVPATVVKTTYTVAEGTSRVDGADIASTAFAPAIQYRYTVQGKTHTGTKYTRSFIPTSADKVKQILDRYPEGARVDVFVDPADPSSAYLEAHTSAGAVILLVLGAFFLALGLLFVALAILYPW